MPSNLFTIFSTPCIVVKQIYDCRMDERTSIQKPQKAWLDRASEEEDDSAN